MNSQGGQTFTDFSRVALTITTKAGQAVKLQIDRCVQP